MLIEAGESWLHALQRTYRQVARALKRARGPVKKAAEVEEDKWLAACRIETNEGQHGVVHRPALMFGFATVWMLREVELAAVYKEDIVINEKEKTVALTLRLTKCDQEAKGVKRTLQCCCPGECDWSEPCPLAISKAALDNVPIEEDRRRRRTDREEPDRGCLEKDLWSGHLRALGQEVRRAAIHQTRMACAASSLLGKEE